MDENKKLREAIRQNTNQINELKLSKAELVKECSVVMARFLDYLKENSTDPYVQESIRKLEDYDLKLEKLSRKIGELCNEGIRISLKGLADELFFKTAEVKE